MADRFWIDTQSVHLVALDPQLEEATSCVRRRRVTVESLVNLAVKEALGHSCR
ncbi:MAG TPA: hypothetical protein VEQ11_02865 [Chloroflexota bacterium]|nr:hypothetical protein [Chloroflexota bacterium]